MTKKQEDCLLDIFKAKTKASGVVNMDDFYAWLDTEQGKEVMKFFNIENDEVLSTSSGVVTLEDNATPEDDWCLFADDSWKQATGSDFDTSSGVVTLDENVDLPFSGDELDSLSITSLAMHCMLAIDNLIEAYKLGGSKDFEKGSKLLDLMITHLRNGKKSVEDYAMLRSIIEG